MSDSQKTPDCFYCDHGRPHPQGSPCGMANPLNEKGHKNGECNRTACANKPALWWNQYTQMFYCEPCARRINQLAGRQICCGMKP